MAVIREKLTKYGLIKEAHDNCELCLSVQNECEELKRYLQELIDQGMVQIGHTKHDASVSIVETMFNKTKRILKPLKVPYKSNDAKSPVNMIDHMVICVPSPFPFTSTKVVPQIYNTTTYLGNKPVVITDPEITNIVGTRGMTCSGRVFTLEGFQKKRVETPVDPYKDKEVYHSDGRARPSKKEVSQEEAEEFFRIINKRVYKVVDQLNQTSSKIYMLSLLLSYEAHITTLMKIMSEDHVIKDITVDQFDIVVANITYSSCLGFSDEDLPMQGRVHNMALRISMKCSDNILSQVLVDTCSSLNVIPKTTLMKLTVKGLLIRPRALVVKAFDGFIRAVIGEVDLPILIGPHTFQITFQVMDINLAYKLLQEYIDVSAQSYQDMSGLGTNTVVHKLPLMPDCPPVKKKLRRTKHNMVLKIQEKSRSSLTLASQLCPSTHCGLQTQFQSQRRMEKYECVWTTDI